MRIFRISALTAASICLTATISMAQQGQPDAYQGVSQPPNDPIVTTSDAPPPTNPPTNSLPKPSAGVLLTVAPQQQTYAAPPPSYAPQYAPPASQQAVYAPPPSAADPDGDMVRPRPARPGELIEGTTIRVKLMDRISSSETEKGEPFRGQVAYDVLQDGKVLIPAGSGIEGLVSAVSSGHFGGHGSFRLRPDAVILPDGSRYMLHAETTGTPGSKTRMGSEGTINAGSRAKKDAIEYGAVVGTGAIAGAVLGGPVGALTGSLVGAGIVTTHLMVNHAQATLEPGAILLFTLTEPMNLMPQTN